MRLPIHKALYWPEIAPSFEGAPSLEGACWGRLDFNALTLEFYPPDMEQFPMLAYAYDAVRKGGLYPCAYNAANEAAAAAFRAGRIGFLDIGRITRYVLDGDWNREPDSIAEVMEADKQARTIAQKELGC
jgi:1-deoxy-D-xylulose-5-phosphate reductoisomerase